MGFISTLHPLHFCVGRLETVITVMVSMFGVMMVVCF